MQFENWPLRTTWFAKRIQLSLNGCHQLLYFWICVENPYVKLYQKLWINSEKCDKRSEKLMCNTYKFIYEGMRRPEAWLVSVKQTDLIKKVVNTVKYQFFKNFIINWRKWYRLVIIYLLLISILMHWNNIYFFRIVWKIIIS